MLKTLVHSIILAPGYFVQSLFKKNKKRYRSTRKPSNVKSGIIGISILTWGLLFFILFSIFSGPPQEEIVLTENSNTETQNIPPLNNEAPAEINTALPPVEEAGNVASQITSQLEIPLQAPPETINATAETNAVNLESWLLILNTVPKNIKKGDEAERRREAERLKSSYEKKGFKTEIFDTDAYTRLLGGNWVVAQGPFRTKIEAEIAATKIKNTNDKYMIRRGL